MTWTHGANRWFGGLAGFLLCCAASVTASSEEVQLPSDDGTASQQTPQPSQDFQGYQAPAPQSYQLPQAYAPQMPGNVTAQSLNVTPQGIGAAAGPMSTNSLVAYKPIPESLLPGAVSSTVPAAGAQLANVPTQTNLGAPAINWGPYTLGPDDVVHIAVRNQPEFTGAYVIGRDGNIQFGFIGDVKADGLTKEDLAREVETRIKRYVRVPSVYVTIVGFNSKAIYILGRVQNPGKYAMRGDSVKIRDAVIAAGLLLDNAKLRRVHVIKSDPTDPTYRVVNLQNVLFQGKMKDNIDLVHGDIVLVPTTTWGVVNDFLGSLLNGGAAKAGRVAALAAL